MERFSGVCADDADVVDADEDEEEVGDVDDSADLMPSAKLDLARCSWRQLRNSTVASCCETSFCAPV